MDNSETRQYSIDSPAKVNLYLKIKGVRDDGYHLLEMVNVTVGLADKIELRSSPSSEHSIAVIGSGLCDELRDISHNLAARAAKLFLERHNLKVSLTIKIDKVIPVGAGLGGGSSNAAATLRGLEEIFNLPTPLSPREMADLLGADVPFCYSGGLAHVTGIGEKVVPLPVQSLTEVPIALVLPPISVSTAEIFSLVRQSGSYEKHLQEEAPESRVLEELRAIPTEQLYSKLIEGMQNDLTPYVCSRHSYLAALLERLSSNPLLAVGMSGSGSTIFVLPRDQRLNRADFRTLVAQITDFDDQRVVFTQLLANS